MSLTPLSADSPVLKIGAVVLKRVASHQSPVASKAALNDASPVTDYEILIVRPHPKTPGEVPPFVLPRGSRQYQDEAGAWHDARDMATGVKHAATLEPFKRALAREIEEEAGVSAQQLAAARVTELGAMNFASRSKGVYPIHWFVVTLAAADASALDTQIASKQYPADATELRWASLEEIKTMAAQGEFSAGYVPVIEAALTRSKPAHSPRGGVVPGR